MTALGAFETVAMSAEGSSLTFVRSAYRSAIAAKITRRGA